MDFMLAFRYTEVFKLSVCITYKKLQKKKKKLTLKTKTKLLQRF